jgi:hypothetical protein
MTTPDEHPVHADPRALTELRERANVLDTPALTAHARTLGITPPDNRPDWFIVLEYDEHGTERGLYWVGPDDL